MLFQPVSFLNIGEALALWRRVVPWEGSRERAWQALAVLQYLLVIRPAAEEMGEFRLSFTDIQREADRIRKYLNIDDPQRAVVFQTAREKGTQI